jgi:predicted transcriptional regulator
LCLLLPGRKIVNKNRSCLDIVQEVLSIALVRVCKTRIMYGASLSFVQLERYLSTLLRSNLLSFDRDTGYLTTKLGRAFLQLYGDYLDNCMHLMGAIERNAKDRKQLENMCGLGRKLDVADLKERVKQ